MDRKSKLDDDTSSQHTRFLETARALGCDEDEAAFDEKLKVIARQKTGAKPIVLDGKPDLSTKPR